LGITPNLRYVDQVQFFQRVNQYDFDMMLHFWSSSLSPGTEQPLYWGCKAADEKGRWNYAGLCTPAIDALTAQIPNASNRDDLIKMTQKLDQLVMDEYGFVPLGYRPFDMIAWRDTIAIPKIPLYGLIKESLIPVR
jgi:ABC-type oligopeptide transport system substrate-binding subunit